MVSNLLSSSSTSSWSPCVSWTARNLMTSFLSIHLKEIHFGPCVHLAASQRLLLLPLREGRTELTGNIDDERPTSPHRTWWTSSISFCVCSCARCDLKHLGGKRELMIVRCIKRMCVYIDECVCICRRMSDIHRSLAHSESRSRSVIRWISFNWKTVQLRPPR
jgi:hypothetical protein